MHVRGYTTPRRHSNPRHHQHPTTQQVAHELSVSILYAHWATDFEEGTDQRKFVDLVGNVVKALSTYAAHLRDTAQRSAAHKEETEEEKQQRMDMRVRVQFRAGCDASQVQAQYKPFASLLEPKGLYEAVDVGEEIEKVPPKQRVRFWEDLLLPFPFVKVRSSSCLGEGDVSKPVHA